jgi:general secretion pathway protein G
MDKIIRKYRKSKGFTLVELLIVIIIIGILAGMMMLAAGSATDKAEATKIVSNLRNIKAAAIMYYADKNDWAAAIADLNTYLDQNPGTGYELAASGDCVGYTAIDTTGGIPSKLALMAVDSALYSDTVCSTDYASGTSVYMPIK